MMSQDHDPVRGETSPSGKGASAESEMAEDVALARMSAEAAAGDDKMRQLADELQAANDRALRAQAELENFRKRVRREVDEERRYAALPLISELLPVVDNLDRAVASCEANASAQELLTGVKMVQAQLLSVLERNHCQRLGQVGEAFDPHRHQAIAQEPSEQHAPGTVTRIARFGYQLHERVVRPAEVMVSSGPPAAG